MLKAVAVTVCQRHGRSSSEGSRGRNITYLFAAWKVKWQEGQVVSGHEARYTLTFFSAFSVLVPASCS